MKKLITLACLLLMVGATASAQINVKLNPVRKNFLAGEPVLMEIALSNNSGQPIELKNINKMSWLDIVIKRTHGDVPLPQARFASFPPVTIASGRQISRRVDMRHLYDLSRPGYYNAQAFVKSPISQNVHASAKQFFTIQQGNTVASRTVVTELGTKCQYNICTLSDNDKQYMYVQVKDPENNTIRNSVSLGGYLNFDKPLVRIDGGMSIHVLFPSTPKHYTYACVDYKGNRLALRHYLRISGVMPRLSVAQNGTIVVQGAVYVDPNAKPKQVRDAADLPK